MSIKVSIITVCYNSECTIKDTIESVAAQSYENIEYIVIDGNSSDGTMDILSQYEDVIDIMVSEQDRGLYDAMNKGIDLATGDLIGILNSDDVLSSNYVIQKIVNASKGFDGVYADIAFYDKSLSRKIRYYSSKSFDRSKFSRGFMPAHPSCYIKKNIIKAVGYYSLEYKIASDFDFLVRAFNLPGVSFHYLNEEVVKMRVGGVSTSGLSANILLNKEIIHSCRKHGLSCSLFSILSKYPEKLLGYFIKK